MNLELEITPRQRAALEAPAEEVLYGGAAGGGKSHLIRVAAITWAMAVSGFNAVIFRRMFPELVRNHMEGPTSFPVLLAPLVNAGFCEIVRTQIRFWNGSKIDLAHMQHEKDKYGWQGAEIHGLFFDELTHFTESQYRYLRGRCRLGGLNVPAALRSKLPRILSGSNPGGVGHVWVRRTFVDAGPMKVVRAPAEEGGMRRAFVPAKLADNPYMERNDPAYSQRLLGLGDPTLVRAMLDGDWSVVAGSQFGDAWRHHLHTCDPFPIPQGWPIWRGGDDGFAAPAACYWLTRDPDTKTIYVIRELYKAGMRPDEFAERTKHGDAAIPVIDHEGEDATPEILGGILDGAAFGDTGQQDKVPRGHKLNELGCRWKPAKKWPGSRVHRCQNLHALLGINKATGFPFIRFFRTCKNAIDTIPALPRDPHNPEDVDTDGEDHAYDAVTYGLQWFTATAGRGKVTGK